MYIDSAEVVIIGGGVSGLSSAYFLAKAGKDVVVVEKEIVGHEASGRSGGMISERIGEPPVVPIAVESLNIWPTLEQELGYPTEFVHQGRLQVALTEEDMEHVLTLREESLTHGVKADLVDSGEVRDMIPGISDKVLGGIFFSNGGHANPQRTVHAFAWAVQDRHGRIYQHTTVTGINVEDDRVSSVETTAGTIKADVVVCAAGPQTSLLGEMVGLHVPVAPARVEIISTIPLEPRFKVALVGNGLYGRQTLRGNLIFGGGAHEWTDVDLSSEPAKPTTPLIRNMARRLAELLPGMEDVPLLRSWAGIVEQTPDQYPIIDKLEHPRGFVLITTSAFGFGICPATGAAVSQLIIDGECSFFIDGLKLSRFEGLDKSWRQSWGWESGAYNT
ncbi:MAG: FAD-binding oxidoreductase [Dehalococcoidia bacterium]